MAMTDEELLLQMNILATKTDSSTNPNMVYKTTAILNKGLDPKYFTGQSTKIVNAINDLAKKNENAEATANSVATKINELLLDTTVYDNQLKWEELQDLMGKPTIIEGLVDLYKGDKAAQLVNLSASDKGKILSVDVDVSGNPVIKAIEQIMEDTKEVKVEDIAYVNNYSSSITNVKNALDFVIDKVANGNIGDDGFGGGVIVGEITWDMIDDRPEFVADDLEITNNSLELKDGDVVLSTIPLVSNEDIDDIIDDL